MNIFENQSVLQYFGCIENVCDDKLDQSQYAHFCHMARRVLESMQVPLHAEDKILRLDETGTAVYDAYLRETDGFHPWYLRLPDKFQTPV